MADESARTADPVRDAAIAELARMVAGIAQRCWENLGTAYASDIVNRCGKILDSLPLPTQSDGDACGG